MTEEPRNYGIIGFNFLKANNLIISAHTLELLEAMSDHTANLYTVNNSPKPLKVTSNQLQILNNRSGTHVEIKCESLFE